MKNLTEAFTTLSHTGYAYINVPGFFDDIVQRSRKEHNSYEDSFLAALDTKRLLQEALSRMTLQQKILVCLKFRGYTNKEAARAMAITPREVANLARKTYRMRGRLRKLMRRKI